VKIDIEILKKLERSIDTYNPEKGEVPIKILGFGEISLVFEIVGDPEQIAYKRIPIFENEKQVNRHIWAYKTTKIRFNFIAYKKKSLQNR